MSRHFSYELNENRIKTLLEKNSMSFSEDVWNEFLAQTKPVEKASKLPNFKINFAINKSVLLTGVFIVLIGSFTALIAKFVDFSDTKSNTENVREVKPEPDNFKLEKMAASLPKKEEAKPTATVALVTSTMMAMTPNMTSTLAATTPTYASIQNQQNSNSAQTSNTGNENQNTMARNMPDTSLSNTKSDTTSVTQVPTNQSKNLRRRKKKEAEVLEAKPLTQELPTTKTDEQEPELKLN